VLRIELDFSSSSALRHRFVTMVSMLSNISFSWIVSLRLPGSDARNAKSLASL
jgi:hypothetical protein